MSLLTLRLLGPPRVHHGGQPVRFPTRKALALLALLAASPGPHTREALAATLWPDSDQQRAHTALRRSLLRLKQAVGAEHLVIGRESLAFNTAAHFELDLDELRRAHALAQQPTRPDPGRLQLLEQMARAVTGDLLSGFTLPDAPEFDAWVASRREACHQQASFVFEQVCGWLAAAGQEQRSLEAAAGWVSLDPYNELAQRRLMELHLSRGDRGSALQAYERHCRLLANELGTQPGPELQALAARARQPASSGPPESILDPEDAAEPASGQLPLLGRTEELARLVAAYQLARRGRPGIALIEGESGIGKTRLAGEVLRWAAAHGGDVLIGRAIDGLEVPYQPLVGALRERLTRVAKPGALLADAWLSELSRLWPELLERSPGLRPPQAGDSAEASARLYEAVARLGQALAARAPLIVFIDDVQWASPGGRDLLGYCARAWLAARAGTLIVLTARSEALATNGPLRDWLDGLARDARLERLELAPLDLEAVRHALAVAPDPAGLAPADAPGLPERVFRVTSGHPLFLVEVLRHLRTGGAPEDLAGLRQAVRARLAQLEQPARVVLAAGAVLGSDWDVEALRAVAGVDEERSVQLVEDLLARRLLREQHGRYTFVHDAVREVVYSDTSEARRRMLHRRALGVLTTRQVSAAERLVHALRGGSTEAAPDLALEAGLEALRLAAVPEALAHLELARSLAETQPLPVNRLCLLYERLGRAHELGDQFGRAGATYSEMVARARACGEVGQRMAALGLNRLAAATLYDAGDSLRAEGLLSEAYVLALAAGDRAVLAETQLNRGQMSLYRLDIPEARVHLGQALEAARGVGDRGLMARALNTLCYPLLQEGYWSEVQARAEEARRLYAELGDRALEVDCLAQIAAAYIGAGCASEGIAVARRAKAMADEIGNRWGRANATKELALGLVELARYPDAVVEGESGVAAARAAGFPPLLVLNLLTLGWAYRGLLDLPRAIAAHREALEASRLASALLLRRMLGEYAAGQLCADYATAGDWPAAAEHARLALSLRRPGHVQFAFTRAFEAQALVRAGARAEAEADARVFATEVAGRKRQMLVALRAQAVLAEPHEAVSFLERALELADELELAGERAQVELELAAVR